MLDFEKMYFHLAGKIADAIEALDKISRDLKVAQIEGDDETGENQTTENADA